MGANSNCQWEDTFKLVRRGSAILEAPVRILCEEPMRAFVKRLRVVHRKASLVSFVDIRNLAAVNSTTGRGYSDENGVSPIIPP